MIIFPGHNRAPSPMLAEPAPPSCHTTSNPHHNSPTPCAHAAGDDYIRYIYHPKLQKPERVEYLSHPTSTVSLLHETNAAHSGLDEFLQHLPSQRPWAPFRTRADFEVAELATRLLAKGDDLKDLICGVGTPVHDAMMDIAGYQHLWDWHDETKVTFTLIKDFESTLARARTYVLGVCSNDIICFVGADESHTSGRQEKSLPSTIRIHTHTCSTIASQWNT
jgi:hypothetical protein